MIREFNSTGLTDYSSKIKKGCTNIWVEKLKAAKKLTQKKQGDFGATFWLQERITNKMLNG